jgi:hypothetical protein
MGSGRFRDVVPVDDLRSSRCVNRVVPVDDGEKSAWRMLPIV